MLLEMARTRPWVGFLVVVALVFFMTWVAMWLSSPAPHAKTAPPTKAAKVRGG
jgi:hypothetical protein